jgi:hypothetical protein
MGIRLGIAFLAAALLAGCEFTNSPLLVEGAFVNATFRVDQDGLPANTPVGTAATVHLRDVLEDAGGTADSVKIYNITVAIDSVTGSTPPATPLSGSASIDGRALFSLSGVPLAALAAERSIFDTSVPGFAFNASGVHYLVQSLRQDPPPSVTVAVVASSSSPALHFTMRVKIYTQVYTTP